MEKTIFVYRYDVCSKQIIKYTATYDDEQTQDSMRGTIIKLNLYESKRINKIPLSRINSFEANINENLYLSKEDDLAATEHYKKKYKMKCEELKEQLYMYQEHLELFLDNQVSVHDKYTVSE